jgi:hypothetical protein
VASRAPISCSTWSPGDVPERVVDLLETVQIQQDQGDLGVLVQVLQSGQQGPAVGQPGQLVGQGEPVGLGRGPGLGQGQPQPDPGRGQREHGRHDQVELAHPRGGHGQHDRGDQGGGQRGQLGPAPHPAGPGVRVVRGTGVPGAAGAGHDQDEGGAPAEVERAAVGVGPASQVLDEVAVADRLQREADQQESGGPGRAAAPDQQVAQHGGGQQEVEQGVEQGEQHSDAVAVQPGRDRADQDDAGQADGAADGHAGLHRGDRVDVAALDVVEDQERRHQGVGGQEEALTRPREADRARPGRGAQHRRADRPQDQGADQRDRPGPGLPPAEGGHRELGDQQREQQVLGVQQNALGHIPTVEDRVDQHDRPAGQQGQPGRPAEPVADLATASRHLRFIGAPGRGPEVLSRRSRAGTSAGPPGRRPDPSCRAARSG